MNKIQPNGEVHPVATLFPMMSDEELDELATDIKANGLLNPITLDEKGVLIDGRNRQEACRRAKVEPTYQSLNGTDPIAFIMSSNDRRRHMKLGQRAMIAAKVRSLTKNVSIPQAAKVVGVAQGYVGNAAVVLQYASDQVDSVISGAVALNDAYTEAQKRKAAVQSEEGKMQRLRAGAPDLFALVSEDRMPLNEAYGAFETRIKKEEERLRSIKDSNARATRTIEEFLDFFDPRSRSPEERAEYLSGILDFSVISEGAFSSERLKRAKQTIDLFISKQKGGK